MFFNQHRDLSACPNGKNFQIACVRRLSRLVTGRGRADSGDLDPRWRDFIYLFLLHRLYGCFHAMYRLRSWLMRLVR